MQLSNDIDIDDLPTPPEEWVPPNAASQGIDLNEEEGEDTLSDDEESLIDLSDSSDDSDDDS